MKHNKLALTNQIVPYQPRSVNHLLHFQAKRTAFLSEPAFRWPDGVECGEDDIFLKKEIFFRKPIDKID